MWYLQIDSYILTNILINKNKNNNNCCSLSLEQLFMLKHYLLQFYEEFFYLNQVKKIGMLKVLQIIKLLLLIKKKFSSFRIYMKNLN